jgi:CheY-like chemotaxis protein
MGANVSSGKTGRDADRAAGFGLRVLIVEDEFLVAVHLENMLRKLGCIPVGPAFTVEGGLALAQSAALSGALLDYNLGGKSALPLVESLAGRGVPIAMVTGYEQELMSSPPLRDVAWVRKPVTEDAIRSVLQGWTQAPPR